MSKGLVQLFDDDEKWARNYEERLKGVAKSFKIGIIDKNDLLDQVETLLGRQREFRKSGKLPEGGCSLDNVSVFLIDLDLAGLEKGFSGEDIAYLARCFSGCELIVGYSMYGTGGEFVGGNAFDLRMRWNLNSYVDIVVGNKQLYNPGLWGEETSGFRPWHWPQLPKYLKSFRQKKEEVTNDPEKPILEVLRIPDDVVGVFPNSVIEFLGRKDPVRSTFEDFVLRSENGLRGGDLKAKGTKTVNAEMVGRIGAARISKWLEGVVLPGQNVLIDAPHLASRSPSLLRGERPSLGTLNRTAKFEKPSKLGLKCRKVENFRFKKEHWLSRLAWFWSELSRSREIEEVVKPWKIPSAKFVFCEDASRFFERERCREFESEVDSPYTRRFARKFREVEYFPQTRFLT